jgi:hypothetical protein
MTKLECCWCLSFKRVSEEAGECRARPPVIVESLYIENDDDMDSVVDYMTRWPVVGHDDWCLEHTGRQ